MYYSYVMGIDSSINDFEFIVFKMREKMHEIK